MSEFDDTAKTLNFDAPNSYVGRSVTRPNARRLTQGRGQYVDDIVLPRMVHVAYVRSPHAHARIAKIETKRAAAMPGVVRIVAAAVSARDGGGALAGGAAGRGGRAIARRSRGCRRRGGGRIRGAARRARRGARARSVGAEDPQGIRQQPV